MPNFRTNVIHHLHITGEIIGYPHSFCNQKVKEFFFLIERSKARRLKSKKSFNRRNKPDKYKFCQYQRPSKIYRHLKILSGKFIYTVLYNDQGKKQKIKNKCIKCIENEQKLNKKFYSGSVEERE